MGACLFAAVRGLHLWWSWSWPLGGDAGEYDRLGWLTATGESWLNVAQDAKASTFLGAPGTPTAMRPPGFPVFLGAVYAVFGHVPNAARVVLVLLNAVASGLLIDLCQRQWGRVSACVAGLGWCFWPVSVRALYYIDSVLSESLALPLLLIAMWCFARERRAWAFVAGVVLSAAILTRPHLAFVAAFGGVLMMVMWLRGQREQARRWALLCAGCAVLWAPWVARNQRVFGTPVLLTTQSGIGTWMGWARGGTGSWYDTPEEWERALAAARGNEDIQSGDEVRMSRGWSHVAAGEIAARGFTGVVQHALHKLWLFLAPIEYGYGLNSALLVTMLLALWGVRSWLATPAAQLAALAWLAFFFSALMIHTLGRFRFVVSPALLFLAGPAVERLFTLARQRWATVIKRRGAVDGSGVS
jgi:4-amino-4-deoxy-L-arabinose transferase-like glycosyltransferase